ncbi:Hypothetical predicted protein [Paramuricea clavata]|uniref:Uncharacterized protein n=1 Tax=Paramuricea clavata TaxID=317549 RepID=A0A6S7GWY9_PARCT|nr:Hypothetical predicted protein [Paramuricea clavata]
MAKDKPLWYHGSITADEATRILTKIREPGAFLLRDSQSTEGAFTLSVSCSVEEAGNFVDVQNYRIVNYRNKAGRKKFPSMKDLDECLQKQTAQRGIMPPSLGRPVEKSSIEEWEKTDVNWRAKFKVHEGEKHTEHKIKDPNKKSSKFSKFGLRKKKKQPNKITEETGQSVLLQDDNSPQDVAVGNDATESNSGNEDGYLEPLDPERDSGMAGNNAMGNNENIYTLNRDSDQGGALNQNIALQKQAEDDCSYDNDSNNLTKSTTTKDLDTEINDEGSNSGVDNLPGNSNTGIYMSSSAVINKNNEVPGKDSFNQVPEINNGIYMSTSGTTPSEMPRRDEGGGGSSANSGIYMAPNQNTNKNNGGSRSQEVGVDSSVTQNEI